MLDLAKLKQTLRELVTDESMEAALNELEKHLPTDVPKYNALLQLLARLNEIDNQRIKNVVSNEQATLQYDKLRDDVLTFFSDLQESDFSKETAKKANMGGVLYRIPERMQHLKKSKCIVRVAYDEALLKDTLDTTVDVVIEALKVSKNMEVRLVDEEGDSEYFEITSRSTPEQFLVQDEFTEWTFFVKPLDVGTYPLALIISLVIYEDGKDRKKDITLERVINVVSEPVPEEAGDHTLRKAGILFALTDAPNVPAGDKTPTKKPLKTWLTAGIVILLAVLLGYYFFMKSQDEEKVGGGGEDTVGKVEAAEFNAASAQNSPEMLVAFLAKYENSQFERQARELATRVSPNIDLDKLIKEYRLRHNITPIDRSQPDDAKRGTEDGKTSGNPPDAIPVTNKDSNAVTQTDPPLDADKPTDGDTQTGTTDPAPNGTTDNSKPSSAGTNGQGPNANKSSITVGNPDPESPAKPEQIKWDDKLRAKEDPINWLPTMALVKGGKYKMGCNTKIETTGCAAFAEPSHEVKLADFHISRFEVTQALWMAVMGERHNPSRFNDCDLCPVEKVSWDDTQDFIKKLNRKTGMNYRLPTEAEWEYASRQGGKDVRFGDGKNIANTARFNFNSEDMPGRRYVEAESSAIERWMFFQLGANTLGLYHMSGNVAEWCQDRWHSDYENAPADGAAWEDGDDNRRVIRGGGWDTEPYATRTFDRDAKKESTEDDEVGFRLAW